MAGDLPDPARREPGRDDGLDVHRAGRAGRGRAAQALRALQGPSISFFLARSFMILNQHFATCHNNCHHINPKIIISVSIVKQLLTFRSKHLEKVYNCCVNKWVSTRGLDVQCGKVVRRPETNFPQSNLGAAADIVRSSCFVLDLCSQLSSRPVGKWSPHP